MTARGRQSRRQRLLLADAERTAQGRRIARRIRALRQGLALLALAFPLIVYAIH